MKSVVWDIHHLCCENPSGSYATRAKREQELRTMALTLVTTLGFRGMRATSLKQKHVKALVNHWQEKQLSPGTIKNRLSYLRWWAEQVNKRRVVERNNAAYGIPRRCYVSGKNKAQRLDETKADTLNNPYVNMSLRLAAAFGLRKEEAIKFKPAYADKGHAIRLKASWCKGGRARTIPITTDTQRQLLDEARALVGGGSLIPSNQSYIRQCRCYENATKRVGFRQLHGLRHQYAQDRYAQLTGWPCPFAGGPQRSELTPEKKAIDYQARLDIANTLGHGRESISRVYLS